MHPKRVAFLFICIVLATIAVTSAATAVPTVDDIRGTSARQGEDLSFVIWGTGFMPGAQVYLMRTGASVDVTEGTIDPTRISCRVTIPDAQPTGYYGVVVRNPGETSSYGRGAAFYIYPERSTEIGISPIAMNSGATFTATITGPDLSSDTEVRLTSGTKTITATGVAPAGSNELRCTLTVPSTTMSELYTLGVRKPGETAWAERPAVFKLVPPLTVTGVSPSSTTRGSSYRGLIVSGTGFVPGAEVFIESLGHWVIARDEETISPNRIVFWVDIPTSELTGYYNVYVRTPGGPWSVLRNGLRVTGGATFTVTGISPNYGVRGESRAVTVYGTHFDPLSEVALQYEPTNSWVFASDEKWLSENAIQCTFAIPATATLGRYNVYVKNPVTGWVYYRNGFSTVPIVT